MLAAWDPMEAHGGGIRTAQLWEWPGQGTQSTEGWRGVVEGAIITALPLLCSSLTISPDFEGLTQKGFSLLWKKQGAEIQRRSTMRQERQRCKILGAKWEGGKH